MISNERPSPYGHRSPYRPGPPKRWSNEKIIKRETIEIERKRFIFALMENDRGMFLRITEDSSAHHNTMIIPASGLKEFVGMLNEMVKVADETPAPN